MMLAQDKLIKLSMEALANVVDGRHADGGAALDEIERDYGVAGLICAMQIWVGTLSKVFAARGAAPPSALGWREEGASTVSDASEVASTDRWATDFLVNAFAEDGARVNAEAICALSSRVELQEAVLAVLRAVAFAVRPRKIRRIPQAPVTDAMLDDLFDLAYSALQHSVAQDVVAMGATLDVIVERHEERGLASAMFIWANILRTSVTCSAGDKPAGVILKALDGGIACTTPAQAWCRRFLTATMAEDSVAASHRLIAELKDADQFVAAVVELLSLLGNTFRHGTIESVVLGKN